MPGQFVRHARTGWEWGPNPGRSDLVREAAADDPEPARRGRGRKDTRHWCKGRTGREHVPRIVLRLWSPFEHECRWWPHWLDGKVKWNCLHAEVCEVCGKILRDRGQFAVIAECPDYPGDPAQKAAAEAEAAAMAERRLLRSRARRRVITGPQGYRRRRQAE